MMPKTTRAWAKMTTHMLPSTVANGKGKRLKNIKLYQVIAILIPLLEEIRLEGGVGLGRDKVEERRLGSDEVEVEEMRLRRDEVESRTHGSI
jgi:hypothetical protein